MSVTHFMVIIDVHGKLYNLCKFGACMPYSVGDRSLTKRESSKTDGCTPIKCCSTFQTYTVELCITQRMTTPTPTDMACKLSDLDLGCVGRLCVGQRENTDDGKHVYKI